ncbi:hypothetical protein IMSHALPRED_003922 [Imshaugia aleurites]|uniref:Uncharacterized protein n=1 Tax=Imshaugia aleurites TaxID=172621 RepID=A0A8H3EI05_9LECA|nr:hypothetical protein IMSHALPRED_003922 [Imshaugia aleurites]
MSADSFAMLRKNAGEDIGKLAEEHFKHDLQDSDRDTLKTAASKIGNHATVGSLLGLGLGLFLAFRVRSRRTQMFNAFRTAEKPTHVKFADGREEAIPDITPLVKPTTLGDIATYFFFSAGGLFLGGETGILTGSASASRSITRDPDSRTRIEAAFRRFRADVLRKEADDLDGGKGVAGVLGF